MIDNFRLRRRKAAARQYTVEEHPAYSFTDPSGKVIPVPAARITTATTYVHEEMSAAEAERILIAVGLSMGCELPIRLRRAGKGFEIPVPAEFFRSLTRVKEILDEMNQDQA